MLFQRVRSLGYCPESVDGTNNIIPNGKGQIPQIVSISPMNRCASASASAIVRASV